MAGGMAERFKAAVLKTVDRKVRGFESLSLRHPVLQIVALQRRMRFSARLAGFCRDRCHQRRARRAERASFSAFVSNPDFRVPRLRQIGWRAADRAVRRRKRGHPRGPESRPGLLRRIGLSRSGQVGLGFLDVLTCLGFGLNQGPAMLESIPFIVAPRLVLDSLELLRHATPGDPAFVGAPAIKCSCHQVATPLEAAHKEILVRFGYIRSSAAGAGQGTRTRSRKLRQNRWYSQPRGSA